MDDAWQDELARAVRTLGHDDLLLLRRLDARRWAHLGGVGRGRGWAGVVEVCLEHEPLLARAVHDGGLVVVHGDEPRRVVGPYFSAHAALVRVDHDHLAVLGRAAHRPGPPDDDEARLRACARLAREVVTEASPAKLLGDELEVLSAVRDVNAASRPGLDDTLAEVVAVATRATSCEEGLLLTSEGRFSATAGWAALGPEVLTTAARAVAPRPGDLVRRVQDVEEAGLPEPLRGEDGTRAVLAVDVGGQGLLVLAHTDRGPRGFTDLCCRVGEHVGEAAAVVLESARLRDELARSVESHREAARRDHLTALANRRAWVEAVDAAADDVEAGVPYGVLAVDLDGLKRVNDERGHDAGDQLLRAFADVLAGVARPVDTAARLGGDEFALLLPGCDTADAEHVAARLRHALDVAARRGAPSLLASIGVAACPPATTLADAERDADLRMYVDKRERRRARRDGPLVPRQPQDAPVGPRGR